MLCKLSQKVSYTDRQYYYISTKSGPTPYYKDTLTYLLPELDSELKSVIGSKEIHAALIFVALWSFPALKEAPFFI